jgi:hypothetical protein
LEGFFAYLVGTYTTNQKREGEIVLSAAASSRKNSRCLHLPHHHRLVPPPLAGFAGVRTDGESNLYVEVSIKIVFFNKLS